MHHVLLPCIHIEFFISRSLSVISSGCLELQNTTHHISVCFALD